MNWPSTKLPHLLLVDDDPIFSLVVAAQARAKDLPITLCSNVDEMKRALKDGKYDAVILDYYLGDKTGTELAELVGRRIPVLLVSHTGGWLRDCEGWPTNITKFVHKNHGAEAILEAVLAALKEDRLHLEPSTPTERPYF